jgi:signal transduction histidine kinase
MWHRRRHRPPWWPDNEPWPPENSRTAWRRGRGRFVRRLALALGLLLLLGAYGGVSLVSMIVWGRPVGAQASPTLIAFVSLLLLFGLTTAFTRRVGLPLGTIVEAANRLAAGDFSTRVAEHGPPSLRVVGRAFNTMAERLEAHDRQRRNLMADVAHELRTPLTVLQGRLEGLVDGVYPRDDASMAQLLDETRLLARLVEDLRTLANLDSGALPLQRETTDLAALGHEVVNAFAAEARTRQIDLRLEARADLPLFQVDPLRIREVLSNLVANALAHTPAGGVVSIVVGRKPAAAGDSYIAVSVADTGSGIPSDQLPKVFDRFFKGAGSRGSGLGLAIARDLVTAHGGVMTAESTVGRGTTISFTVPLA